MPANTWEIGALYPPGGLNNIKWSQPSGVGGIVYPQQQVSADYYIGNQAITPFSELTGIFSVQCGHFCNYPLIQQEWDFENDISVALICCPICGFVQYTLSPFSAALDTVAEPQLPI